jgi:hypothetical protein
MQNIFLTFTVPKVRQVRKVRLVHQTLTAFSSSLLLSLLFAATPGHALPISGKKTSPPTATPSPEFDRATRLFHPDAYANIPEGRSGKTIGLAIIPRLHAKSDGGEKSIAELIGHIPAISMAITMPPNDPLYLSKFLKYLKSTGRKVDFLFIAGHGLQKIENDDVVAINLGSDESQRLTPAVLNVVALENEIAKLETSGADPAKKKELCDKVDLIYEGASALVPGAQLILHSCYAGHSDQTEMMKTFATAFLGVNGGSAIGPKYATRSEMLGTNSDPKGVVETLSATITTRALQIGKIMRAKRYVRPGDAYLETQFYTELSVPANKIKVPTCCGQDKEAWRKLVGLWRTGAGSEIRISCSASNELSGVIEKVPTDCKFAITPGAISFKKGFAKSSNTVQTDSAYCYPKKADKITPVTGPMKLTISVDGQKISGKQTLYQYYDGSKTFDAGTVESSINWTRIGN